MLYIRVLARLMVLGDSVKDCYKARFTKMHYA